MELVIEETLSQFNQWRVPDVVCQLGKAAWISLYELYWKALRSSRAIQEKTCLEFLLM